MTTEQRKLVANGLINLGNIAAGLLIFGQALSEKFHIGTFIYGMIVLVVCYIIGTFLSKGGESK